MDIKQTQAKLDGLFIKSFSYRNGVLRRRRWAHPATIQGKPLDKGTTNTRSILEEKMAKHTRTHLREVH
ncbi:MAG: hypothetical protein NVS1B11_32070 [Terriglobales bacterium]